MDRDEDWYGDYALKLVVLGDSGVGKSCLLKQFAKGVYDDLYVSTIGVDFETRKVTIDGTVMKLYLWDTAGQERFRNITRSYYRGADVVVLVYDTTDKTSFDHVKRWVDDVHAMVSRPVSMYLVGNKCDLEEERAVTLEQGNEKAGQLGMPFIECSAKSGHNVETLFQQAASEFLEKARSADQRIDAMNTGVGSITLSPLAENSSSKCCK